MQFEVDIKCKSCGGTGLYSGMGERDGAAVVCHTCKGTGCHHHVFEYEPFAGKVRKDGIRRVYRVNPGICIGENDHLKLEDFGGIPFGNWENGEPFPTRSEDRKHTCPAWWYQSADYKKKPNWDECNSSLGSTFSRCPYFCKKEKCWERWDYEFGTGKRPEADSEEVEG